jgi:hypothetical protein
MYSFGATTITCISQLSTLAVSQPFLMYMISKSCIPTVMFTTFHNITYVHQILAIFKLLHVLLRFDMNRSNRCIHTQ